MRSAEPIPPVLVVAADRLARSALVRVVEEVAPVVEAVAPRRDLDGVARRVGAAVIVWDLGREAVPEGLGALELPVVVLTEDAEGARRAVALGADAVLDRDGDAERLELAIRGVLAGLRIIDRRVEDEADPVRVEPLTAREREVLELLAGGLSDRRIGEELGISAHTAKFHVHSLRTKLGVATRTEAVVAAMKAGLVRI
jgi:DNA-binding NarL/FixJ family response regulator